MLSKVYFVTLHTIPTELRIRLISSKLPEDYYHPILYINPIPRIIDFAIGIFLALLVLNNVGEQKDRKKVSPLMWYLMVLWSFVVVIAISLLFPTSNPYSVAFLYWIPIGSLIYAVASGSAAGGGIFKVLDNKLLNSLGNISFTFYMLHQLVMRWARLIMKHIIHDDSESFLYMIIVVPLQESTSEICWWQVISGLGLKILKTG